VAGTWTVGAPPDRGAHVASLRCPHGTEWLAAGGWDECFPNIAVGRHPTTGAALADHGDLWDTPGPGSPWSAPTVAARVTREITAEGDALRVRYTAVADRPVPVAWAMHLLLDAPPAAVQLAIDVPVRIDSLFGTAAEQGLPPGGWLPWGELRPRLLAAPGEWAAKVFTRPGSTSEVRVARDREALVISFADAPVPPCLGLWFNAGALPGAAGVRHLGVEPSFGDHDDLAEAVASGSTLPVTSTPTRWSVRLAHEPAG